MVIFYKDTYKTNLWTDVRTVWLGDLHIQNCTNKCISTVIVNLCYKKIYIIYIYIYVYDDTRSHFLCVSTTWAEEIPRKSSLYITVNERTTKKKDSYWLWMYSCFCSTDTFPTWMLLLLLCDKMKKEKKKVPWPPKRAAVAFISRNIF